MNALTAVARAAAVQDVPPFAAAVAALLIGRAAAERELAGIAREPVFFAALAPTSEVSQCFGRPDPAWSLRFVA
jgi:hypothetical protein